MLDLTDPITGLNRPMKVLVATTDEGLRQDLEAFLNSKRETRLVGATNRSREVLDRLDDWEPDVLLVEEGMDGSLAVDITRSLKQNRPKVAVFVMVHEQEYKDANYHRRLMGANASGVFELTEPLSFQDWIQPMRDAVELLDKIPDQRGREFGQVMAIHSLKGGVGRTVIATNLSAALTRQALQSNEDERRVLLLDLNWPFGGVDTFLNLVPARSALDLLSVMDSLNKQNILNATTGYLWPGLRILVSPLEHEQSDYGRDLMEEELFYAEYDGVSDDLLQQIKMANVNIDYDPGNASRRQFLEHLLRKGKAKQAVVQLVRRLLTSAPRYFDHIIVDLPPIIDELTLSVLRNMDRLIVVCTPDVPSIRALRSEIDLLPLFNITEERIYFVLNRVRKNNEISPEEVKVLFPNKKWLAELPEDPKLETLVNTSTLALEVPREIPFALGVKKLAEAVLREQYTRREELS